MDGIINISQPSLPSPFLHRNQGDSIMEASDPQFHPRWSEPHKRGLLWVCVWSGPMSKMLPSFLLHWQMLLPHCSLLSSFLNSLELAFKESNTLRCCFPSCAKWKNTVDTDSKLPCIFTFSVSSSLTVSSGYSSSLHLFRKGLPISMCIWTYLNTEIKRSERSSTVGLEIHFSDTLLQNGGEELKRNYL